MVGGPLAPATRADPSGVRQSARLGDVVITTHHINPVRDARTPWDEVKNCLRDTACQAAVKAIAAEVGIPPEAIELVNAGAAFTATQRARGNPIFDSSPERPQSLSRAIKGHLGASPATGDRAESLFSLSATQPAWRSTQWTPRRGIAGGRSWYDGNV